MMFYFFLYLYTSFYNVLFNNYKKKFNLLSFLSSIHLIVFILIYSFILLLFITLFDLFVLFIFVHVSFFSEFST